MQIADSIQKIKSSATIAVAAKVRELKSKQEPVIGLNAGEPDFDTPLSIKQAAIDAIHDNDTRYTAVEGTLALREKIVEKFNRDNNLTFDTQQIIVSTGAKQAIYQGIAAILNPGDEVLVPSPYWTSYPDMIALAGGQCIPILTTPQDGFKLTPEQLRKHITQRTKLIILNSPNNPTGAVYNKEELAALGQVLVEFPHVAIITDDIYEYLIWDQPFYNLLNACPELADRTLVVNGVSKAYAMTGWRIGYAAGPKDWIAAMKKIQSQTTSGTNSIAQAAATEALSGGFSSVQHMTQEMKKRHDVLYKALNEIDGITTLPSHGTFYLFIDVSGLIEQLDLKDDIDFCHYMLDECKIAMVPGQAFGRANCVRVSFATSMSKCEEALSRIKQMIATKA
ncbi:MAG: pyridoxal phosphate-dependent aminotransferase [Candidatus Comchoanobacterales bacterium]